VGSPARASPRLRSRCIVRGGGQTRRVFDSSGFVYGAGARCRYPLYRRTGSTCPPVQVKTVPGDRSKLYCRTLARDGYFGSMFTAWRICLVPLRSKHHSQAVETAPPGHSAKQLPTWNGRHSDCAGDCPVGSFAGTSWGQTTWLTAYRRTQLRQLPCRRFRAKCRAGEPGLFPLRQAASQHKSYRSCVTSGYWATSKKITSSILESSSAPVYSRRMSTWSKLMLKLVIYVVTWRSLQT